MDETGFALLNPGNVVVTDYHEKYPYEGDSDAKEQISVLGCISAVGAILPPTIIYPGVKRIPKTDFENANHCLTANGQINNETFINWLRHTFIPNVKHQLDDGTPVILFVDGHQSHISLDVHEICIANNIIFHVLPANASRIIQPLDLVFYGSLEKEWAKAVRDFKEIHRAPTLSKKSFASVFKVAWEAAYTHETCIDAFIASGLSPWDPHRPDYSKVGTYKVFGPAKGRTIIGKSLETSLLKLSMVNISI